MLTSAAEPRSSRARSRSGMSDPQVDWEQNSCSSPGARLRVKLQKVMQGRFPKSWTTRSRTSLWSKLGTYWCNGEVHWSRETVMR